jgi:hypothetical protein
VHAAAAHRAWDRSASAVAAAAAAAATESSLGAARRGSVEVEAMDAGAPDAAAEVTARSAGGESAAAAFLTHLGKGAPLPTSAALAKGGLLASPGGVHARTSAVADALMARARAPPLVDLVRSPAAPLAAGAGGVATLLHQQDTLLGLATSMLASSTTVDALEARANALDASSFIKPREAGGASK